jgi:putative N6-adenine-specific DNA methylase
MNKYFAICPRGLEPFLSEELRLLGAQFIRETHGGVHFSGEWALAYRANLESRIATRILWFIAQGGYRSEEDIYRLARRQNWPDYFAVTRTLRVVTTAIKCPLKSLDFVTLRVKDAVCDRFREVANERPTIETRNPDVRVHVFLTDNECTLYLDTSGQPLWQRGLRKTSVEAPLKENLAAGILKMSGWQPGMALVDPMCGSGTFLLEAIQVALDRAPGLDRAFAFEMLADFDAQQWGGMRQAAEARCKDPEPMEIRGYDLDEKAVRATRRNLQEAGFGGMVTVDCQDLLDIEPLTDHGIMVANPPYGERIGEAEALVSFYPQLGSALKKHWAGWHCFFFSADMRLPKGLGLKPSRKTPLFNGPLECRLFEIRMVAGSNRPA